MGRMPVLGRWLINLCGPFVLLCDFRGPLVLIIRWARRVAAPGRRESS